jgi:predicted lipoprotein with Yx(FWY)xxD motif
MSIRRWAIAMTAVAGLAGLAACGESGATGSEKTTTDPPTTSSSAPATSGETVQVASLGGKDVLTDGAGRALYLFTKDTDGTSTCVDDCLAKWPALAGPATAGDQVDDGKLGTTTRPEGTVQVTYAGKPLYYFAMDKAPGDTKGQSVNQVWYLVNADGEAVK